jgi:hypothetical protein
MSTKDLFDQLSKAYPSTEWISLRAPFPRGIGVMRLLDVKGRVNESEFQGRAPETMYFVGPEGSSGRLGTLHFFFRPEGWNTERAPDGSYCRVVYHETNRGLYELADFGFVESMIVPNPYPFWHGSREVAESLTPGRHVDVRFGTYNYHTDPTTLLALVRNVGTEPISGVSLRWDYEYERLQPTVLGDIPFDTAGGGYGLVAEEGFSGTIPPGQIEPFVLPVFCLSTAANLSAALSPERHRLVVLSDNEEICRVDGRVVGGHLEQLTG